MTMKKFFLAIAAVALVASASCTKVDPEKKADKISFNVANYMPATKAPTSLIADGITSFQCKAWMIGEGVAGYQSFFGANGETITPDNETNPTEWAPSHVYYWPKSEESYINFFSYYDTGAGPDLSYSGSTFTMKWENRTIAAGDNIMYADPAWRFQNNDNDIYDQDGVTEGVPTLFHHGLAQVEFRVYATALSQDDPEVSWTIKLTDMNLEVANQGTLVLTATEPTSGYNTKGNWDGTPAWTATGTAGNIMPTTDFSVTATDAADATTAAKVLTATSVLPQDISAKNLTFKLDITTTYGSGANAVTNHEIISESIALGAGGFATAGDAWKLNTKYIYTIKIATGDDLTKVLFDPAVETAWTTETYGDKEI